MKSEEKILVVDDDRDFLDIIRKILEKKGFKISAAPSASDALSMLKKHFYNAAILDISLPDADGTELLSNILELHPEIITIMLTGHSSVKNAVQSLNRGAFAYLEKPVDPENLISVINRGMEKQRLVLENRQLVNELERHNHVTNSRLSVSQAVAETLDLQKIIDSALQKVAECTGVEASFVFLRYKDRLKFMGHHGLPQKIIKDIPKEVSAISGIFSNLIEQSGPIIAEDLVKADEPDLKFIKKAGYRSFAGVPLTILGENIGGLGIATAFNKIFSPNNLDLLTGIGRAIAIAVRNAKLYEEASSARALRELDAMGNEVP